MKETTSRKLPAEGEIFELTLDADSIDPISMVGNAGNDPTDWKFEGERLKGRFTKKFRLLRLGYYVTGSNEAEAQAAAKGCRLARGEWHEAFKAKYPSADGSDHILFGGKESKWIDEDGKHRFPALTCSGYFKDWWSKFVHADDVYYDYWLWLVEDL